MRNLTFNEIIFTSKVNEVVSKEKNTDWYLHMRSETLLINIQKVLSHVKNLEVVAASLYFVVNSLPLGEFTFN